MTVFSIYKRFIRVFPHGKLRRGCTVTSKCFFSTYPTPGEFLGVTGLKWPVKTRLLRVGLIYDIQITPHSPKMLNYTPPHMIG